MIKFREIIRKMLLLLFVVCMTLYLTASKTKPDSLFFESFNLRYQNPDLGIVKAKELFHTDTTKAFLSMSFNYFFKSNYDSAKYNIELALKHDPDNSIVQNMNKSLDGWINQRLGKYYEAYQSFNDANDFYSSIINNWLYKNDPLFWQAYALNSLGNITFQFYYLKQFDKIDSLIVDIILPEIFEKDNDLVPLTMKAHSFYLILRNYITNSEKITEKKGIKRKKFEDYFQIYTGLIEDENYYQKGNFYEILGLLYPKNQELVQNLLTIGQKDNTLCQEAFQFLKSKSPELHFFLKALEYFIKHGDVYQIAGQYYHIGAYYRSQINLKLNANIAPEPYWLDSMDCCINRSLNYQYIRDITFFKELEEDSTYNMMKDSVINKLVSLHWCILTLQLRHFHTGIKPVQIIGVYNLRPESFNMKLLRQLEKQEDKNISEFFSLVKNALSAKITSDRNRNYTIIASLIIIIIVILSLVKHRHKRRKEKEEAEKDKRNAEAKLIHTTSHNEAWNRILNELFSIWEQLFAEKKELHSISFDTLNQELLHYFDAEYCAVGLLEDGILHDKSYKFNHEIDKDIAHQINQKEKLSAKNTIIGNFLKTKSDYAKYEGKELSNIYNEHLEVYQLCMKSGKIENIHLSSILGLNGTKEEKIAFGYISLINLRGNVSKIQEELAEISSQLAGILEGEYNRQIIRDQNKDERFINGLVAEESSIDDIVINSCEYLAKEFNAGIVSFRVPIINGPDEEPGKNLKLVLRHLYVDPKIPKKVEIVNFYKSFEKNSLSLSNDEITYKEFLNGYPDDIYVDWIGQREGFFERFSLNELFLTKTNFILPIKKLTYSTIELKSQTDYWRKLCGIINIQPYTYDDRADTVFRMKTLVEKITYLLNHKFNISKNAQINALHFQINKLNYEQLDTFYNDINDLVRIVMNAEMCSIFIHNKTRKKLELKATSAKKVFFNKEVRTTSEIPYLDEIYYSSDDVDSITWDTYSSGVTHLIYNIKHYNKKSTKFIEISDNGNLEDSNALSRLFIPLRNTDALRTSFGVIKCMGTKFSKDNLIHSFWDFDRETVEFISALATQLIEYATLIKDKDTFIKQMVHETTTPITEMLHNQIEYYNRLTREKRKPPGYEKYHNNLVNNIMLQKQILIDLESISSNKSSLSIINPSKENTRQLLQYSIRLFEDSAFYEKGVTFLIGIKNLPDLNIDRSRIQQVFINLIRNAVQYSEPNSQIKILYEHVNKYIDGYKPVYWHEIKFQNDGIGILESEVDDIFLLYRRGSNAHKARPSGSGIGLYLVDQIVRAHFGICKVVKLTNPTEISIFLPSKKK